jgi:hypothetical protein
MPIFIGFAFNFLKSAQRLGVLFLWCITVFGVGCSQPSDIYLGYLVFYAGEHDRMNTTVRYVCRYSDILGDRVSQENQHLLLIEKGGSNSEALAQWQPVRRFEWEESGDQGALICVVPGRTPAKTARTFDMVIRTGNPPANRLSVSHALGRNFSVNSDGRPLLRYNYGIVREQDGQTGPYDRSCYIHPIWTPSGKVITGDFSPEHIHQRGLFMAWRPVKFGDLETDFWGLGDATGRILNDEPPAVEQGPVFTQLILHNKGTVAGETYFKEIQLVTVYAFPHDDFWLFDITVRQTPVDPANPTSRPTPSVAMQLQKLHYGGMSFRATSDWLRQDAGDVQRAISRGIEFKDMHWLPSDVTLDIATSAGHDRTTGDRNPARWIDYTGPLGDAWGGAAMFDHPGNLRYPTPVRIHPQLPYYSWAFVQNEPYTIQSDNPLELTYRVLVHDGHPNTELNERLAADLAHPPLIKWQPAHLR